MPPVLTFVPGTMCDQRVWTPVWEALGEPISKRYIPVESRLTRDAIREAFDEAATDGPMHLVGFSMGGYLALEYALDRPGRVASLAIACTSARGLSEREKSDRAKVVAFLESHDYRGIATSRLNQFVHPSRQDDPRVVDVIRAMDRDLGGAVLLAQMRETTQRASLMPRLAALSCPVLFMGADADNLVPWDHIGDMHALVPQSRLARAVGAGHMLPLEQPDWIAARLSEFHGLGD